mgnify:CR=1 FL=1
MKKRKVKIITGIIAVVVTLALIGLVVFGIVRKNTDEKNNRYLEEQKQAQQQTEPDNDTSKSDETTGNEDSSLDIPDINEIPDKPDKGDDPDIDVSEMTRNPEPEVVDSEVKYGTKESESNEE